MSDLPFLGQGRIKPKPDRRKIGRMRKSATMEELAEVVADNYCVFHRPVCVKKNGTHVFSDDLVTGIVIQPDDAYMDLIGPFTEPSEFWHICQRKFSDKEFMVIPHLVSFLPMKISPCSKPFVWRGSFSEFGAAWEID